MSNQNKQFRDRKQLTLDYWRQNVDRLLEFNGRPVLAHNGNVSTEWMKAIAHERYETFDNHRRNAEAIDADAEDLKALATVEKQVEQRGREVTYPAYRDYIPSS